MAPTDIDLVEMAHTAVAGRDGDIFELNVHVIFGYTMDQKASVSCPTTLALQGKARRRGVYLQLICLGTLGQK